MGHAYELQIPRGRKEWETSLMIQRDFPTSVGCMMPTLIIATSQVADPVTLPPLPALPARSLRQAENATKEPPEPTAPPAVPVVASTAVPTAAPTGASTGAPQPDISEEPLDVRGQAFFDENCRMVNRLIQSTRHQKKHLDEGHGQERDLCLEVQRLSEPHLLW